MAETIIRLALALPLLIAVWIGVMTLFVARRQHDYVYVPGTRTVDATPTAVGLAFEELVIETADGERLQAWFVPAPAATTVPGKTILFCHGNAGTISDLLESLATFHRLGFATLVFDYRGYGASTGRPDEQGTYADAAACLDYLVKRRGVPAADVIAFGRSMGGAVASHLAVAGGPGLLVLESVFASVPAMARHYYPYLPVRWFCRIHYDNLEHVARVRVPVLVIHSRADETCPFEQGRQVFEAAREPKLFIEVSGGHNDGGLDAHPECQQALLDFVRCFSCPQP